MLKMKKYFKASESYQYSKISGLRGRGGNPCISERHKREIINIGEKPKEHLASSYIALFTGS